MCNYDEVMKRCMPSVLKSFNTFLDVARQWYIHSFFNIFELITDWLLCFTMMLILHSPLKECVSYIPSQAQISPHVLILTGKFFFFFTCQSLSSKSSHFLAFDVKVERCLIVKKKTHYQHFKTDIWPYFTHKKCLHTFYECRCNFKWCDQLDFFHGSLVLSHTWLELFFSSLSSNFTACLRPSWEKKKWEYLVL